LDYLAKSFLVDAMPKKDYLIEKEKLGNHRRRSEKKQKKKHETTTIS